MNTPLKYGRIDRLSFDQQLSRRYRDTPRHIRVIAWLMRFL